MDRFRQIFYLRHIRFVETADILIIKYVSYWFRLATQSEST